MHVYWTLDPERGWVIVDLGNEDVEIYCANDHPVDPDDVRIAAFDQALSGQIVQIGMKLVQDRESFLVRSGIV